MRFGLDFWEKERDEILDQENRRWRSRNPFVMSDKTLQLLNHCETSTTIRCDKCKAKDVTNADEVDSLDELYAAGWRVINGKCLCRKCAKKK